MVSIERDKHKEDRFKFNRPFSCIDLKFGESSSVLPHLPWGDRTILWLDYDGRLDGNCLRDISSFCANAASGSLLVVSVNAHFPSDVDDPIAFLKTEVGSAYVPNDIAKVDFAGWNFAKLVRRIVSSAVVEAIKKRNGVLSQFDKFTWQQVLSFDYADGAKMTTIGGVLATAGEKPHFDKCSFSTLTYYRSKYEDAYKIDVPSLTWRELRHLDKQLPLTEGEELVSPGISSKTLRQYAEVYRYYPNFAETEQQ